MCVASGRTWLLKTLLILSWLWSFSVCWLRPHTTHWFLPCSGKYPWHLPNLTVAKFYSFFFMAWKILRKTKGLSSHPWTHQSWPAGSYECSYRQRCFRSQAAFGCPSPERVYGLCVDGSLCPQRVYAAGCQEQEEARRKVMRIYKISSSL